MVTLAYVALYDHIHYYNPIWLQALRKFSWKVIGRVGGKWEKLGVLMGDIVRSERSLPQELLHKHFNEAVAAQNKAHLKKFLFPR